MTEKQFEIICEDSSLVDIPVYVISDDKLEFDIYGSEKDAERLCTVLNENEQLKSELKDYSDANAQLEERCSELLTATSELGGTTVARGLKIQRLEKENEQLKQIMKGVYDLLFEEVDVFTDKAIEHDINAYIELKELDNKDAYYMAIATKKAIKMLKECIK